MIVALCEVCKGIDPDNAWEMRMDVGLMMLDSRARMMERANKSAAGEDAREPRVRTTAGGKREVQFKGGFNELVSAARALRGAK